MKPQKIYLDTSVIGGCFDEKFSYWSNRLLHDFKNQLHTPFVSELTAAEIENAPHRVKNIYYELIDYNNEILTVTEDAIELAEEYQSNSVVGPNFYNDGLHIALATVKY